MGDGYEKNNILLSIFISLLLFTVAAYSVSISLSSDKVAQLGGTGNVEVMCPATSCQIEKVKWVISGSPPYEVSAVEVTWIPASDATYDIYVTLYDNSNNVISSGSSRNQSLSGGQETTTKVYISPESPYSKVLPKDVKFVEIVIVQTDWT
ncbi:MAG: hypothetical protein QW095_01060 [Nitrososphaerota archaeon]